MAAKLHNFRVALPGMLIDGVAHEYGQIVALRNDDRAKGLVRGGWLVPQFDNPEISEIEDKLDTQNEVEE